MTANEDQASALGGRSLRGESALLYDKAVGDWPGEIDFYLALAGPAIAAGEPVLEVACGTGRVSVRLAEAGARVTGLDRHAPYLAAARAKSAGLPIRLIEGDMRDFDLGEQFALIIMPGHSFQHMLTPEDQLAALTTIAHHLPPGGTLVVHLDHQDVDWLGELSVGKGTDFHAAETISLPEDGLTVQVERRWTYDPVTQTATATNRYTVTDAAGAVVEAWQGDPLPLHCVFRFEMAHLLARAGLAGVQVYGDFSRGPLTAGSTEMIWVARKPQTS